jgi:hypothetical protein
MSTTKSTDFLNPAGLVAQYPTLSMSVFRDCTASFVSDHTFKVLSNLEKSFGTTPFPKEQWNTWENITSENPVKLAANKVEKPKKVADPNDPKKKIVMKDQLELVDQRLKNPVSFNASAKQSLTFLITSFVHECFMAKSHITASDADSIRNTIVEHANANCDYVVSDLMFEVCDKIGDDVMSAHFNTTHGKFKSSFEDRLNKIITDNEALRNVVLTTVLKFLKAYTLYVGSNTWFEVKESKSTENKESKDENDVSDAHETEGVSKTLGTKNFRQFLMDRDMSLMPNNARLDPSFYTAMTEYYAAVESYDKQRSAEAAAAKAAKKQAADAAKANAANAAADATTEVPPPAGTDAAATANVSAPAPAPTARRGTSAAAVAATAAVAAAENTPAPAPAPAPAAAEQLGRRRRAVAGAN